MSKMVSGIDVVSGGLVPNTGDGTPAYLPALEQVNASQMAMANALAYRALVGELVKAGAVKAEDVESTLAAVVDEMRAVTLPGCEVVVDLYRKALG
jgi:hypothetical protein